MYRKPIIISLWPDELEALIIALENFKDDYEDWPHRLDDGVIYLDCLLANLYFRREVSENV